MSEELIALLALSQVDGIGGKQIRRLRRTWGRLAAFWEGPPPPMPPRLRTQLSQRFFLRQQAEAILARCEQLQIRILPFWDPAFPPLLEEIPHPPAVLYQKGSLPLYGRPCVAVVGTRKPSPYGLKATAYFVEALVEAGAVIVSGLAYGIDAQAHRVTLQCGGQTIAVLAHGLDRIYPTAHRRLADEILATGAWVSEYPPDTKLHPLYFPFRNRIIAGLAQVTLLIESREKGGALFTAQAAFAANRPVFAVPGDIFSPTSTGAHRLIVEQMAQLAYTPAQILSELSVQADRLPLPLASGPQPEGPTAAAIYALLADGMRHIDEVAAELSLSAEEVMQQVILLEIEGWITQRPGGYLMRAAPPNAIS